MTNRDLAATLFNIATLLRDRQDNPYRIRAYERGARALMGRRDDVVAPLQQADKTLPHRRGVLGERLQKKLKELAQTGELAYLAELCEDLPPHVLELMCVPGIGPRTAQRLYETLGIETPEQLFEAAASGRLRRVWGFGAKREQQFTQLSLFDAPEAEEKAHREERPRLRMAA